MARVIKDGNVAIIEKLVDGEWKPVKWVERKNFEPLPVWEHKIKIAVTELEAPNA